MATKYSQYPSGAVKLVPPVRYAVPDLENTPGQSPIAAFINARTELPFFVTELSGDFMGRRAVAKRKIPKGSTLIVESSHVWMPHQDAYQHMCHCCGKVISVRNLQRGQSNPTSASASSTAPNRIRMGAAWLTCSEACHARTASIASLIQRLCEGFQELCQNVGFEVNLGRIITRYLVLSALDSDAARDACLPTIAENKNGNKRQQVANDPEVVNGKDLSDDKENKTRSDSTQVYRVPLTYVLSLHPHPRLRWEGDAPPANADPEEIASVEGFAKGLYLLLPPAIRTKLCPGKAGESMTAPKDFIKLVATIAGIINANSHGLVAPTEAIQEGTQHALQMHHKSSALQTFLTKATKALPELQAEESEKDLSQLFLLSKLDVGSFGETELGAGVFPLAAQFNHCCDPNATFSTSNTCDGPNYGATIQVRAIRDIDEGEEIFVNYVPLDKSRYSRRMNLVLTKGFVCSCMRCLRKCPDVPSEEEREETLQRYAEDWRLGATRKQQLSSTESKAFMEHDRLESWKTGSEPATDFWLDLGEAHNLNEPEGKLDRPPANPLPVMLRRIVDPVAFGAAQINREVVSVVESKMEQGKLLVERICTYSSSNGPEGENIAEAALASAQEHVHKYMELAQQYGKYASKGEKALQIYKNILTQTREKMRQHVEAAAENIYRALSLSHEKMFELIPLLLLAYTQSYDAALQENDTAGVSKYRNLILRWAQTQVYLLRKLIHKSYPGLQVPTLQSAAALANCEVAMVESLASMHGAADEASTQKQLAVIRAYSQRRKELIQEFSENVLTAYGPQSEFVIQLQKCGLIPKI